MLRRLVALLLAVTQCVSHPLDSFINEHVAAGNHIRNDVPEVIRGSNFTKQNLVKYFDLPLITPNHVSDRRILVGADEVIAIGKEVWTFMEENKPVMNLNTDYAGAVPNGVSDWTHLSGWKNALKGPYTISWINGFNLETVHIDFKWASSYGGRYDGVGQYITQAGPLVGKIDVSWGYTVDVSVRAFSPLNVGTKKTPVSQIDIELTSRISNVLKDVTQNYHARFTGSGDIMIL